MNEYDIYFGGINARDFTDDEFNEQTGFVKPDLSVRDRIAAMAGQIGRAHV